MMSKQEMTLARFGKLVASYGADPQHWPGAERAAARALIASQRQAAEIAAGAAPLDRLLAGLAQPVPANAALKDRLEAVTSLPQQGMDQRPGPAQHHNQRRRSLFGAMFGVHVSRTLMPQAAGLIMACLVGGVALGLSDFAAAPDTVLMVDPSAYFFGDPGLDKDLEELD